MQLVQDKYYIWYNRVITVVAGLTFVLVVLIWSMPMFENYKTLGLRPIVGILAIIQVAYSLVLYKRQASNNIWSGTLFSAMLASLIVISIVHNSGRLNSWFMIAWFVQVLLSGMFGIYVTIATGFVITFYYVIALTSSPREIVISVFAIGMVLVSYFCGLISYLLWKKFYVHSDSQKVNQLSGQLKGKQQQSEVLIQAISDAVIVVDLESKIALLNPAAAKMTGWTVEEAIGLDVQLVTKFSQEDGKDLANNLKPFDSVIKTGKQFQSTLQLNSRDNSTNTIVSLVISPVIQPKSTQAIGAVAVLRDVSEARHEEHRSADFISTASHEMRTPVAAIEGYLALALNEKVAKIDPKAREFLEKAHESTQRLGKLFQDLLTSAKAEDGRLVNHPVVTDIGDFLERIVDGLRFSAEKKGLLMDFTIGNNTSGKADVSAGGKVVKPLYYAFIDPDRMGEVITNLFDNAVKYSDNGKISVGLTGNDDLIQFYIRDTGHGIPQEDLPHLFQKFYRVDNSSTRTIGGTGLGLFICRKIVELYKGRIWVESEQRKGSTFYINLPRLSAQKAAAEQAKESQIAV